MLTIRIKTKSTKKFSWNGSFARSLGEKTANSLREAVAEALEDFQTYARSDGLKAGEHACLVTWEDGDDLHAFIYQPSDPSPTEPPWVLMRSQPARVLRGDA